MPVFSPISRFNHRGAVHQWDDWPILRLDAGFNFSDDTVTVIQLRWIPFFPTIGVMIEVQPGSWYSIAYYIGGMLRSRFSTSQDVYTDKSDKNMPIKCNTLLFWKQDEISQVRVLDGKIGNASLPWRYLSSELSFQEGNYFKTHCPQRWFSPENHGEGGSSWPPFRPLPRRFALLTENGKNTLVEARVFFSRPLAAHLPIPSTKRWWVLISGLVARKSPS